MVDIKLRSVELPDFPSPTVEPVIPPRTYTARIEAARARASRLPGAGRLR